MSSRSHASSSQLPKGRWNRISRLSPSTSGGSTMGMSTIVSIRRRPGNRYRDSRYHSGVATQMESNAAIVQERMVNRNADWISGFITAALKSSNEVNIRSAASSKTISKMKQEEMPLMTRKNGRSAHRRFSLDFVPVVR